MTNGVPGTRYSEAAWWEEAADILTWLFKSTPGEGNLVMEALDAVASMLREGPVTGGAAETVSRDRWQRAEQNCRRATDLIDRLRRRGRDISELESLHPMYQGALEHACGNFAGAITRYEEAERLISLHRHNKAVATLARALAHLRQNLDDQVPEVMDALQILLKSEFSRSVEEHWRTAREAYRLRMVPPPVAPAAPPDDKPDEPPIEPEVKYPANTPSRRPNPYLFRVLAVVAVSVAVLGAVIVAWASGISQAGIGLIAYGIAFVAAVIGYLLALAFEKPLDIPTLCVALIDGPGGATMREGPVAYRGWPLLQKARAIVPLNIHNYVSSKQKVSVRSDLTVEVSLAVRYRVHYYGPDEIAQRHNVSCAVHAALDLLNKPGVSHQEPWQPAELRSAWQRKLLGDIRLTLYQALPMLITSDRLDQDRALMAQRLRERLQEKVDDWGMLVVGVWIADLNKAK